MVGGGSKKFLVEQTSWKNALCALSYNLVGVGLMDNVGLPSLLYTGSAPYDLRETYATAD